MGAFKILLRDLNGRAEQRWGGLQFHSRNVDGFSRFTADLRDHLIHFINVRRVCLQ